MSDAATNAPPKPAADGTDKIDAYIDFMLEVPIARRNEIIAAINATIEAYPTIDDDKALGEAGENKRMAVGWLASIEAMREETKDPYWTGGKHIDARFKIADPLSGPLAKLNAVMADYGKRKAARVRKEAEDRARATRAESDRKLAEARAVIARAPASPTASDALAAAEDAEKTAQKAERRATARDADLTRARGEYGAVISARTIWRYRVVDEKSVPQNLWSIDDAKVKGAIVAAGKDATGKPLAEIAGIEIYAATDMGVR